MRRAAAGPGGARTQDGTADGGHRGGPPTAGPGPRQRPVRAADPAAREPGPRTGPFRRSGGLWRRPGLLLSLLVIAVTLAAALWPELFTGRDPLVGVPADKLLPPGAEHPFGTDQLGRDVYARTVHGASTTLPASALAVLVGLVGGTALGLVAGTLGGRLDGALMRCTDVLLAIPALLLALAVVTALGFGTAKVAVAVGVTSVASFARIMRAEVLRVRSSEFVEAARAGGGRPVVVMLRHVLPNSWGPVVVFAAVEFGTVILAISALGFLGYGAPPPAPEWGSLVADGRDYTATAWWLTALPGATIAATVLAANRISRALEEHERGRTR